MLPDKRARNIFIQIEVCLVQTTVVMKCSQIQAQNESEKLHSENLFCT